MDDPGTPLMAGAEPWQSAGGPVGVLVVHGFTVPGANDTDLTAALEAIPGTVLALTASWLYGSRAEGEHRPNVL